MTLALLVTSLQSLLSVFAAAQDDVVVDHDHLDAMSAQVDDLMAEFDELVAKDDRVALEMKAIANELATLKANQLLLSRSHFR